MKNPKVWYDLNYFTGQFHHVECQYIHKILVKTQEGGAEEYI